MAKILIIDDEETVRFSLHEMLVEEGHVVEEAADGEEGLAKITDTAFDLVITDLIMPRKEGTETIAEIKARYPGLPVLAISGGSRMRGVDPLVQAKVSGAVAILRKPFSCSELLEMVDFLLKRNPL
jgi:CheY-like chemotaxis protein